jgi:hypothetical protein
MDWNNKLLREAQAQPECALSYTALEQLLTAECAFPVINEGLDL